MQKEEKILRNYKKEKFLASKFNITDIGQVLAELISSIENEEYLYYEANYKGTCRFYEEGYGYDYYQYNYRVHLINKKRNICYHYEESYLSEAGSTIFKFDKNMIVLAQDRYSDDVISFYDGFGNKSMLIDVKNYDYIYNFIDYVINYRIENCLVDLDKEELLLLLSKFLEDKNILYQSKKEERLVKKHGKENKKNI